MATEKTLNELSLEELQAKEKSTKSAVNLWTAIMILMALGAILNTIFSGFSTSTLLPLCFVAIFLSVYNNWKKVKDEIARRNREM